MEDFFESIQDLILPKAYPRIGVSANLNFIIKTSLYLSKKQDRVADNNKRGPKQITFPPLKFHGHSLKLDGMKSDHVISYLQSSAFGSESDLYRLTAFGLNMSIPSQDKKN